MKGFPVERLFKILGLSLSFVIGAVFVVLVFVAAVEWHAQNALDSSISSMADQFPVTVDPQNKMIVENDHVNAFFDKAHQSPQAAALNAVDALWDVFEWIAGTISQTPWYQNIAGAAGLESRLVTITPGMRKEQVASSFAKTLGWNTAGENQFMTPIESASLPLREGSFQSGAYLVDKDTTPLQAQMLVNQRFIDEILEHYGTSTAEIVPLDQALTIASLIEREAGGSNDRRIISGIIWNRLFSNMRLQIDATLQYAKANSKTVTPWWPRVVPADISRKSAYNTYQNMGLPPTPIANPSVASVLAALNPKKTDCMFYFHDDAGQFHCTNTYKEHVAMLKKYFGRGK